MNRILSIAGLCVAFAGCNAGSGTSPPAATTYSAGNGPFGPGSNTARAVAAQPTEQIRHVSESRSQSVSPDGRTVRTETTRTGVSFDPDRAIAALGGLAANQQGAPRGVVGEWRAQSSSNRVICSITLYGDESSIGGQAESTGCGFGGSLYGISGWRIAGGDLQFLKGANVSISLQPVGPGRFQTQESLGFLTTTISLYR